MSYKYYEGDYDQQDPYAKYGEQRDAARERLTNLLVRGGKASSDIYDANRQMADTQKYNNAVNTGDDTARGVQMGSQFGPWGAVIGGAAGRLKGGFESFNARRQKGDTFLGAASKALSPDVPGLMDSLASTPGGGTAVSNIAGGMRKDPLQGYLAGGQHGGNIGANPAANTSYNTASRDFQFDDQSQTPADDWLERYKRTA